MRLSCLLFVLCFNCCLDMSKDKCDQVYLERKLVTEVKNNRIRGTYHSSSGLLLFIKSSISVFRPNFYDPLFLLFSFYLSEKHILFGQNLIKLERYRED